jgi:hypothetical protein
MMQGGYRMKGFFRFMAGSAGRAVRIVAGLILIAVGIWAVGGIGGWILAIVGLVPLLAGALDRCVFAPLFGLPFVGPSLRRAVKDKS